MSWFNNIFGRGKGQWEIERDKQGNWSYFLSSNVSFLEGKSEKFLEWSLENPVLFAVCMTRAKLYAQMHISCIDTNTGEEVKNAPEVKLLENPNYFQSKHDFLFQQSWFLSATGNDLIYQKRPFDSELPKSIYNLIPSEIDYKDVLKIKKFISTAADIKELEKKVIKYKLDKQEYELPLKDLIPLYDVASGLKCNSLLQSPSRVLSITRNIKNIDENLKATNINLQMSQKFLARNKNSINGSAGLVHDDDREAIENVLRAKSLQITNGDIEIQHLVTDLKRLYLNEEFAHEATVVANAFEMNKDVINYALTGSTFENQETGIIRYIQNSIQADADNTMNSLTNSWGMVEKNRKLKASYNHLPIMQTLINSKIETFNKLQEGIKTAMENGTMSMEEAKQSSDKLLRELGL